MKVDRIRFNKLKLEWEIRKYGAGVLHGDQAIGEILSSADREHDEMESLRALMNKGYDLHIQERIPDSSEFKDNDYLKYLDEAYNIDKVEYDAFGNSRKWSRQEVIKEKMAELEELGRKLLDEEKYLKVREAQEIWDKLNEELNKLK